MWRKLLCKFSKSKISNFGLSFVEEDIGYLEIPVDDILLWEISESLEDIPDDWFCPLLVHFALFPESWLEISLVAELGDYVAVSVAREDFEASEDIGVVQLFEYVDLWEEQFFEFFAFEGLQLYDFDGDHFVSVTCWVLVTSWCARYTFEKLPCPSRSENLKM